MKVLALELSTARGGLSWLDNAESVIHVAEWPNDRQNSGSFFEQLQTGIRKFGRPDKIMVGLGPGSYAGIRIAISAAIGIGAAGDIELVGYPSICAMKDAGSDYVVVGDARRRSFFFVRVSDAAVAEDYALLDENELNARLRNMASSVPVFSSDSLPQFQPRVEQRFPSVETLACLAFDNQKKFFRPPLEPIYLREPNITIAKPLNQGSKV